MIQSLFVRMQQQKGNGGFLVDATSEDIGYSPLDEDGEETDASRFFKTKDLTPAQMQAVQVFKQQVNAAVNTLKVAFA